MAENRGIQGDAESAEEVTAALLADALQRPGVAEYEKVFRASEGVVNSAMVYLLQMMPTVVCTATVSSDPEASLTAG